MSKELHCRLIDQICVKAGISDPESQYESCNLVIDDVHLVLMHGGDTFPDYLFIYVDFGEPPAAQREMIYRRLLQTNLFMYSDTPSSFALNARNDHVTLVQHARLAESIADTLWEKMTAAAHLAKVWRTTHLLRPDERLAEKAAA